MKEILPGIYQMALTMSEFPPGLVNSYLIKTGDGYLAIDTGWDTPSAFESMEEQLAEIGARVTDIKQVILTHFHLDHMGMIVRFKQSHDVKTYFPRKDLNLFKILYTGGYNYLPLTDKFLLGHGFPKDELVAPETEINVPEDIVSTQFDVLLQGGEEIPAGKDKLKVINTPGHTPGHISLYEPDRKLLFSGDVLLPTIDTNAAMYVENMSNPLQEYLDSLLILKELDIEFVLPGHEYPFTNHRQRIEELFRNHHKKSQKVCNALSNGESKTAYDISRDLAWSARTKTNKWAALAAFDKRFAVLQTIAHLESLRFDHKVGLDNRNTLHYYHLVS